MSDGENVADVGNEGKVESFPKAIPHEEDWEEPEYEFDPSTSPLIAHAEYELERAGIGDEDADYNGALAQAVMALIRVFAEQGHSGYSAMATLAIFNTLARFEPLGDITSDPDEWGEVSEGVWQNKRRSTSFSRDGGKTWYDIDDHTRNNGDTWFSKEDTDEYVRQLGIDPDERSDIILDAGVKSTLWDETYELQRAYRDYYGYEHDGSVVFDAELNRKLRENNGQYPF